MAAATLAGCSVHPIPDDLGPDISTESIVKSVRCEVRAGIFAQIDHRLKERHIGEWNSKKLRTKEDWKAFGAWLKARGSRYRDIMEDINGYSKVAVAYDFDFNITENDTATATAGFKLPLPHSVFDLSAGAGVQKTRVGQRTFKAQESFAELLLRDTWCDNFQIRERNIVYPITGSLGLGKLVKTFVELSEQGGGKDSFVDTLMFTTTVAGNLGPSVKIDAVPKSFRLVNASATIGAGRTDMHKLTISLAFPQEAQNQRAAIDKLTKRLTDRNLGAPADASYQLNTLWRARYNICVADARNREETFKALRQSAPEVYCITYADAFVPRYAGPDAGLLPPQGCWYRCTI